MEFADKVVVVTGGSSGIGAATALAFAKKGASVVIVGRNEERLAKTAAAFKGLNALLVIRADITNDVEATSVIQRTIDHFGKLDVLVNNAGTARLASILEGDLLAAYDEVMAINLRAIVHLTTLAAPHLIKTKGNIVNISSVWAVKIPYALSFVTEAVSKSGLTHFTKCAALELAPHGVRVNAVSPGPVRTDILETAGYSGTWDEFKGVTALNRVSEPEEIAELIMFLASDKAKSITGSDIVFDNGMWLK